MQLHGQHTQSSYFPISGGSEQEQHLEGEDARSDEHDVAPLAPAEASQADISLLGTNTESVLQEDIKQE